MIQHGIEDVFSNAPVEVVLTVQPMLDAGGRSRRRARWSERLATCIGAGPRGGTCCGRDAGTASPPFAIVSGFGAARILMARGRTRTSLEYEGAREESAARRGSRAGRADACRAAGCAAREARALLRGEQRAPAIRSRGPALPARLVPR